MIETTKDFSFNPKQNEGVTKDFDIFYKKTFGEDIQIFRFDKEEKAQRYFGTDVVLQLPNGIRFSIDEKTRRNEYAKNGFYPIELISNVERNKLGWFYTNLTQHIAFGTLNENRNGLLYVFMFPLSIAFKNWVEKEKDTFRPFCVSTENLYHTSGKLIHYTKIRKFSGRENCYQSSLHEHYLGSDSNDK